MSVLVTLGNTNLGTFNNVCLAVRILYPNEVNTLLVFDTEESIADGREGKRNESVRQTFPGTQIRSHLVRDSELQTTIPLVLAHLLGEVGTGNIIIDLTNGQKAGTSVLYAVATISRIERIHSLEIKDRQNLGKLLTDLVHPDDWDYKKLEPLKEIDAVAQHSYLELFYYRREIAMTEEALYAQNPEFTHHATRLLTQALEDYFKGMTEDARYSRSIATLGILCEDIARTLYNYCKQSGKTNADTQNFAGYVGQLGTILGRLRGRKVDWREEGHFGEQMLYILPLDLFLGVTATLRNISAHPPDPARPVEYKCRQEEARLMLNMSLLMLKRLGETDVLSRS